MLLKASFPNANSRIWGVCGLVGGQAGQSRQAGGAGA